jgi:carbon monoxide dehydrogenase subunit G
MNIDIAASPEEVWEVVMNPDRLKDWVTIHRAINSHSSGPPREGYCMDQSMILRGAPFKVKWELVRCDTNKLAEWQGKGPARSRAETGYRLEQIEGGTRFHYFNEFKAPLGPLGSLASRVLVGGLPDKEAKDSLGKLKALLEK